MIYIGKNSYDPYFNIAAEEYILKHFTEDVLMLWQSEPSVVVGKHQNTLAEINHQFIEENKIPVIRRISGGGTVYHDRGNLNYTLITTNEQKDKLIDFKKFTNPVIAFLKTHDITAMFEGKNNLKIDGKKISGNSAHVFKNRVMHHGTILFDSDLQRLDEAIISSSHQMHDKAVKSVRATVTNLKHHFNNDISFIQFKTMFRDFLFASLDIKESRNLSKHDMSEIGKLVKNKYQKWDWNYGYSPAYVFRNELNGNKIRLTVKNGIIEKVEMEPANELAEKLLGVKHHKDELTLKFADLFQDKSTTDTYLKLLGY